MKQAKCGRISKAPGGPKLHSRKQINNHFRNPKLVNAAKVPRKTSLNDTSKKTLYNLYNPKKIYKRISPGNSCENKKSENEHLKILKPFIERQESMYSQLSKCFRKKKRNRSDDFQPKTHWILGQSSEKTTP